MSRIESRAAKRLGVLAGLLLLMAACASSPRVQYFTLPLPPAPTVQSATPAGPVVAVGPVSIPETVDRAHLVLNLSASRVEVLDDVRWAQPLRAEVSRGLAAHLAQSPGLPRVQLLGQATFGEPDVRVVVDILRFESRRDAEALIEAQWSLRPRRGGQVQYGHALVREPVTGTGFEALAAAHGRALAGIAREIARVLPAEP